MDPSRRELLALIPTAGADPADRLREVEKLVAVLAEQVNRLSRLVPPVGAVAAYPAPFPKDREGELGWLVCDGRKLDKPEWSELRRVLVTDMAPDYRGLFLRGLDRGRGLDPGRRPSVDPQTDATRMPRSPFSVGLDGVHDHLAPTVGPQRPPGPNKYEVPFAELGSYDYLNAAPTAKHPGHTHPLAGGDAETRPVNQAVDYIIRFR